ncbi:MAG: alpha/beta fold hydrolase [Rhodoferax sp.]|nr:alpha/beta fold hydrolase [Rhodoferax sp.]
MLARMLRFTIAVQMIFGAALGSWLSADRTSQAGTVLCALLLALLLPLASNVLTIAYSAIASRAKVEPAALWWKSLLGECWVSIYFFLLRQPWTVAPPSTQASTHPQPRLPVLLVHGFVCNHRVWDAMVPALRAQGYTVLAINLEPLFTSIDNYAPQLEQAVQVLRQQTGQDQVALLGHSMGGLAIRAWMRRYGTAHAARAITLGTPHAGTQVKAPVAPPNGLQMAWNSTWLQELAAAETDATRSLFRIALTAQDNIVYPQRAQTLQGVTPTVFEGMGHLQLCTSDAVRQWVCQELALR